MKKCMYIYMCTCVHANLVICDVMFQTQHIQWEVRRKCTGRTLEEDWRAEHTPILREQERERERRRGRGRERKREREREGEGEGGRREGGREGGREREREEGGRERDREREKE